MNDPRYKLELHLHRDSYQGSSGPVLTCSLYATLKPVADDNRAPTMRASMFLTSGEDFGGEYVYLVMSHTGVRLSFKHQEVGNIRSDERDRIHALLLELRGVDYRFTPDLFGFLKKDGSDVEQRFSLNFPVIEANHDNG